MVPCYCLNLLCASHHRFCSCYLWETSLENSRTRSHSWKKLHGHWWSSGRWSPHKTLCASCHIHFSTGQAGRIRWRQNCRDDQSLSRPWCGFHRKKWQRSFCCSMPTLVLGKAGKAYSLCFWASHEYHRDQVSQELPHPRHRHSLLWLMPLSVSHHMQVKWWQVHVNSQFFSAPA